jgi:prevent-host-death family protein
MGTVNLKQARERLGDLVDAAGRGESTLITRRGKRAARIVPAEDAQQHRLPDLAKFRASVTIKGAKMSKTVIAQRRKGRY